MFFFTLVKNPALKLIIWIFIDKLSGIAPWIISTIKGPSSTENIPFWSANNIQLNFYGGFVKIQAISFLECNLKLHLQKVRHTKSTILLSFSRVWDFGNKDSFFPFHDYFVSLNQCVVSSSSYVNIALICKYSLIEISDQDILGL